MAKAKSGSAGACAKDRVMTRKEAEKFEAQQTICWRPKRRVAVAALMHKIDFLASLSPTDLLEMVTYVDDWRGHLTRCIELADCARARVLMAASKGVHHVG